MFNQTFVDGIHETRKPYAVALSLVLQVCMISSLVLIPLVYSEGLPGAQLKSLLVAPAPPPAAPTLSAEKMQLKPVSRRLDAQRLIAPAAIPKQLSVIREATPAPDVGVPGSVGEPGASTSAVISSLVSAVPNSAPPPPIQAAQPKVPSGPVRIGGVVAQANLIRQVQPIYPPLAKAARVQGVVEFSAIISKEGNIEHLQLVNGHPLLVNAAKEAVLQWKYRPTLLNGQAVEVTTEISVVFALNP